MSPEPVNRWHARRVTRTLWLVLLVSCLEALAAEEAQEGRGAEQERGAADKASDSQKDEGQAEKGAGTLLFFWNGRQITDMCEELPLRAENEALFLQLVPLRGG